MKIAIVTDSNSGITQKEGKELGISVIPMPFMADGKTYFEDIDLNHEDFFQMLARGADISTSQPAPQDVTRLWDELLKDYEGKVFVVNNQRISVTQRQSVMDALGMAQKGYTAEQIKNRLEETKFDSSIYITVDTLKYLKKGGRITPAAAAIGTVLNLKPVLQIQGEKLDAYAKVRGKKQAKKVMLKAMRDDFDHRFAALVEKGEMCLFGAYTGTPEEAEEFKKEIAEVFPGYSVNADPLSLSVACHIGNGALAIACAKRVTLDN